jgi:hypothetical protein
VIVCYHSHILTRLLVALFVVIPFHTPLTSSIMQGPSRMLPLAAHNVHPLSLSCCLSHLFTQSQLRHQCVGKCSRVSPSASIGLSGIGLNAAIYSRFWPFLKYLSVGSSVIFQMSYCHSVFTLTRAEIFPRHRPLSTLQHLCNKKSRILLFQP